MSLAIWSPRAIRSLDDLIGYLHDVDPSLAQRALSEIEDWSRRLAERPYKGRRSGWRDLHQLGFRRWKRVAVYQVHTDHIWIADFIDMRRDFSRIRLRPRQ